MLQTRRHFGHDQLIVKFCGNINLPMLGSFPSKKFGFLVLWRSKYYIYAFTVLGGV